MRQVLAQPRPKEDSFTSMVANMGRPKATSSVRRKSMSNTTSSKARSAGKRFNIDSSGSDEAQSETPVKGKSKLLSFVVLGFERREKKMIFILITHFRN